MEIRKSVHSYLDNDSDFLNEMNRMHKVHYGITIDVLQAHAIDHANHRQCRHQVANHRLRMVGECRE